MPCCAGPTGLKLLTGIQTMLASPCAALLQDKAAVQVLAHGALQQWQGSALLQLSMHKLAAGRFHMLQLPGMYCAGHSHMLLFL
jgi:hypothetical protein